MGILQGMHNSQHLSATHAASSAHCVALRALKQRFSTSNVTLHLERPLMAQYSNL